ncbi:hypothetical protein GMO_15880 [Gluconobacter morbifer G707]|uniref:Uncharacterized protein n=1 Tax=Gluconobacter morbifer G707 TaxID=1088869 RepID=G6XJC2_9PROT|nr:hypothetical protein GMO_15880 [Gluconobacter morbifer G707]
MGEFSRKAASKSIPQPITTASGIHKKVTILMATIWHQFR